MLSSKFGIYRSRFSYPMAKQFSLVAVIFIVACRLQRRHPPAFFIFRQNKNYLCARTSAATGQPCEPQNSLSRAHR
jgi:hypothetical protein